MDARFTAASLQTRSVAIVSSCGALIALFLGLAAIVTAADGYTAPFEIDALKQVSAPAIMPLSADEAYPEIAKAQIAVLEIARGLNATREFGSSPRAPSTG